MNFIRDIQRKQFVDERGTFLKIFDKSNPLLADVVIQQGNLVMSRSAYTLRGLHYQRAPFSESKIFMVTNGSIQLVAIDLRPDSEEYKKGTHLLLDPSTNAYRIPGGFATGYCTLENHTEVLYLSDNVYSPEHERGIRWNDPAFEINWPTDSPILSEKDKNWPDWK